MIRADGGTRTASITGAFVALGLACKAMKEKGAIRQIPLTDAVAAVSVGLVGPEVMLDLDYGEDSNAEVDMNVVMTGSGKLVEVQATAEGRPFSREELGPAGRDGAERHPGAAPGAKLHPELLLPNPWLIPARPRR